MIIEHLVLRFQAAVDRLSRRLRAGPVSGKPRRRLLIIQIDGLSRAVLEQARARGYAPFLDWLLRRHDYKLEPMTVGLPTSTPAFQLAAMYGVRPDIPGFHYHDKRQSRDVHFPRTGHAADVEKEQTPWAAQRRKRLRLRLHRWGRASSPVGPRMTPSALRA